MYYNNVNRRNGLIGGLWSAVWVSVCEYTSGRIIYVQIRTDVSSEKSVEDDLVSLLVRSSKLWISRAMQDAAPFQLNNGVRLLREKVCNLDSTGSPIEPDSCSRRILESLRRWTDHHHRTSFFSQNGNCFCITLFLPFPSFPFLYFPFFRVS